MKTSLTSINSFLNSERIAIAGVSRNPKKFGRMVFDSLSKSGFDVVPINPNTDIIDGCDCYPDLESLPTGIDSLLIATPKDQTDAVLQQAISKGFKNIWVQQHSDTDQTLKIAEEYGKEIIANKCIFMFAEPVTGFHSFHRTLVKLVGRYPKTELNLQD